MLVLQSAEEGTVPVIIFDINFVAVLQQHLDSSRITSRGGEVQWCCAKSASCDDDGGQAVRIKGMNPALLNSRGCRWKRSIRGKKSVWMVISHSGKLWSPSVSREMPKGWKLRRKRRLEGELVAETNTAVVKRRADSQAWQRWRRVRRFDNRREVMRREKMAGRSR